MTLFDDAPTLNEHQAQTAFSKTAEALASGLPLAECRPRSTLIFELRCESSRDNPLIRESYVRKWCLPAP